MNRIYFLMHNRGTRKLPSLLPCLCSSQLKSILYKPESPHQTPNDWYLDLGPPNIQNCEK